jgi:hypothetical protein
MRKVVTQTLTCCSKLMSSIVKSLKSFLKLDCLAKIELTGTALLLLTSIVLLAFNCRRQVVL